MAVTAASSTETAATATSGAHVTNVAEADAAVAVETTAVAAMVAASSCHDFTQQVASVRLCKKSPFCQPLKRPMASHDKSLV